MIYLGDFTEDASVWFLWPSSAGDGASITRATDGTIKVRRDDGTDCTGTSVTDTEDTPDTGIHECTVDTSDNANFATGHDYVVWLDGAVIDGETVNAPLAQFSIESRPVRMAADGLDAVDIDSTGTEAISAAKALELLRQAQLGKAAYTDSTGVWQIYGHDGSTLICTATITDEGDRNVYVLP